jgi:hypothetical protein
MAVSKKAKALYNAVFDGVETWAANMISFIKEQRDFNKYYKCNSIPKEYADAYKAYWKKYGNFSPKWGWYYASKNGNQDVRYVPHTLYYTKIDQYFNARKLGYGFNDKNYYSKLFNDAIQPTVLVRKINGLLFDAEYTQISCDKAEAILKRVPEVICKPSQETGSGRGIFFLNTSDEPMVSSFLTDGSYDDYIVQVLVEQHPELCKVHKNSLNTIRICSLLLEDGVHILSSVLRMGVGKSRVDNATASDNAQFDGMTCGINEDGRLKKYAFGYNTGKTYTHHPDGLVFEGFNIPSYEKAVELIKLLHPRLGHFRLVSWDIAINAQGEAVLIEANMRKGGINFHQFNNGPLFGELTDRVLDEVFGQKTS